MRQLNLDVLPLRDRVGRPGGDRRQRRGLDRPRRGPPLLPPPMNRDDGLRLARQFKALLVRRGFPSDLVRARLAELWPGWRDALDGLEAADDTGD